MTDEVASSPDGPWTTVEKSLRSKESTQSIPGKSITPASQRFVTELPKPGSTQSIPGKSVTQPTLDPITVATVPVEFIPPTTNNDFECSSIVVHQLDTTHFLIEGMSVSEVFDRLAYAAAKDHSITGSFPKSGLIRGSGKSGLEFVVTVMPDPRGVTFLVEGKTQQGAANIGVLFDPLSVKGWGMVAAVGLLSAAVRYTVAADVSTLMENLLESVGAPELLMNKGSGSVNVTPEKQRLIAMSQEVSALVGYKLASDEVSMIVKCERAAVTLLGHDKISTLHPHSTLIHTIHRLFKSKEAASPQGILGKIRHQLTGCLYFYNVALESSTNTVTVESTRTSDPIAISAYEMTSSLSLVLVTSKCRYNSKLRHGLMHKLLCNEESFIRDAIASELQIRMS